MCDCETVRRRSCAHRDVLFPCREGLSLPNEREPKASPLTNVEWETIPGLSDANTGRPLRNPESLPCANPH